MSKVHAGHRTASSCVAHWDYRHWYWYRHWVRVFFLTQVCPSISAQEVTLSGGRTSVQAHCRAQASGRSPLPVRIQRHVAGTVVVDLMPPSRQVYMSVSTLHISAGRLSQPRSTLNASIHTHVQYGALHTRVISPAHHRRPAPRVSLCFSRPHQRSIHGTYLTFGFPFNPAP